MGNFWTVKVAGVSGSGKTTLLSMIGSIKDLDCRTITYSELFRQYQEKALADFAMYEILDNTNGLVLIDEHLEFENPNRATNYTNERTKALILLDPPLEHLLKRLKADKKKKRFTELASLQLDLKRSRNEAYRLSEQLEIPLLICSNLEGEVEKTVSRAVIFIQSINKVKARHEISQI
jgi:adenylate kinase